jgi:predicted component of type VI protein secretion system
VPKLVVFRGDAVETEIRLTGATVCIGRDSRNDIVLDDSQKGVSRFHAEIRAEGGRYVIADLKSRNGIWVNGQRIKEKAPLALGVPVTLGAYELTLEDDVSTTEFGGEALPPDPHTAVNAASVDRKDGPSRSGTRASMRSPAAAARQQMLLWSGVAAATVLSCVVTYGIVRYRRVPPPPPVAPIEQVAVVQEKPAVPVPTPEEELKKAEDARKAAAIVQHLADARVQIAAHDYAGALRDHLQPVLELEPDNAEALELKRQADEAIAAAEAAKKVRTPPKPETPAEVETSGIPRKPNEAWPDYTARVARIKVNFQEGNRHLDKGEFASAIARFHLVERDQPRYLGVDLSITEATAKQQKALEEALTGGQANEQAGKLLAARRWYQKAQEIDPGSTAAREKNAALLNRMNADALKLLDKANFAVKSQNTEEAIRLFQQIVDLMLPGDELHDKAVKQLEELKR